MTTLQEAVFSMRGCLVSAAVLAITLAAPLVTPPANAQIFETYYAFTGGYDGATPQANLISDKQGNFYGTTYGGGAFGFGAVFKLGPVGEIIPLHSFAGVDGSGPDGGLVRDDGGNLYGTTRYGGTPEGGSCLHGCGTVFKLDPLGKMTVLYAFTGGADGGRPGGNLARDAEGNLFGTTPYGNTSVGTVFKVGPSGQETVLYAFTGGADGEEPEGGVIQDASGNLYGTTYWGGVTSGLCPYGCGVVFKVDPSGNETVLYAFTGSADGGYPMGSLFRDAAGNLYGTTTGGGDGNGTVFKLDNTGKETVLYAFSGGADGSQPYAGVTRDSIGNLFGTTITGGDFSHECPFSGCGVVYKLDQNGREKVLYAFPDGAEQYQWEFPTPGVILDKAGNLYGTYAWSGNAKRCGGQCGSVYKIIPGVSSRH